jgi:hypothetical protein
VNYAGSRSWGRRSHLRGNGGRIMSPRTLLEVSLRVIGCWFIAKSLVETPQMLASYVLFANGPGVSTK